MFLIGFNIVLIGFNRGFCSGGFTPPKAIDLRPVLAGLGRSAFFGAGSSGVWTETLAPLGSEGRGTETLWRPKTPKTSPKTHPKPPYGGALRGFGEEVLEGFGVCLGGFGTP